MIMNMWSIFKDELVRQRSLRLHPLAFMIMCDMAFWSKTRGCPFIVTDTVSTEAEDLELKRVSATHREARAFDVSLRSWNDHLKLLEFKDHFNDKYFHLAAIAKDGTSRLIVEHDAGTGNHMHVQINSLYKGGIDKP